MISKEIIDRIIDTAQIVDVIGDFVALKRRGANYTACCPFHHEKTPSFSVSPSKGIYKCFGCGKAGNVVNFVMEHEHLGYIEALKFLGRKYGIDVVDREETPEDAANRLKSESLLAVSQFAQEFYTNALHNTGQGKSIGLSYFKERGFSDEIIKKFLLGWATGDKEGLCSTAIKAGYKKEFIVATGLGVEKEGSGELFDRFHDRVIFPVHSISGRIIAFGGRTLRTDKSTAKYINSPESEIYVKSRTLYGIFFAKSAITRLQKCYLVEGYTDVISFHQAGVENVVASSGTSLTTEQIRLIKRFAPEVTVLYDGDAAGIKASIRGIDMLLEEGLRVKVVLFPDGEDPDSFARKSSPEELKKFLNESEEDFIAFKARLLSEETRKDPVKRAQLISEVVASIAVMPDAINRAVYIEDCAERLGISEKILASEVKKLRKKRQYGAYSAENTPSNTEPGLPQYFPELETGDPIPGFITNTYCEPAEKELLYYLLKFGEYPLYESGKEKSEFGTTPKFISVSQFILTELQNDELELHNLIYKEIFNEYYLIRHREPAVEGPKSYEILEDDMPDTDSNDLPENKLPEKDPREISSEERQEGIQRHFINHRNSEYVNIVLDLLHQEHNLTIKVLSQTLMPEEQGLTNAVPKAILVYKAKITAIAYQDICDRLAKSEKEHDSDKETEYMEQLRILMQVKNTLSKALNRLTI